MLQFLAATDQTFGIEDKRFHARLTSRRSHYSHGVTTRVGSRTEFYLEVARHRSDPKAKSSRLAPLADLWRLTE